MTRTRKLTAGLAALAALAITTLSTQPSFADQVQGQTDQPASIGYAACNAMTYMDATPAQTVTWLQAQYDVPATDAATVVDLAVERGC